MLKCAFVVFTPADTWPTVFVPMTETQHAGNNLDVTLMLHSS